MTECPDCDAGVIWNNADPTSNMFFECDCTKAEDYSGGVP